MKEHQAPNLQLDAEDPPDKIIQLVRDYLRHWPWFMISALVFMTLSYFYLRYTPKVYETSAKIKVLEEGSGVNLDMEGLLFNKSYRPIV